MTKITQSNLPYNDEYSSSTVILLIFSSYSHDHNDVACKNAQNLNNRICTLMNTIQDNSNWCNVIHYHNIINWNPIVHAHKTVQQYNHVVSKSYIEWYRFVTSIWKIYY